jgi:hypothetical protein
MGIGKEGTAIVKVDGCGGRGEGWQLHRFGVVFIVFICTIVFLLFGVVGIGEVADVGKALLIKGGMLWDGWLGRGRDRWGVRPGSHCEVMKGA